MNIRGLQLDDDDPTSEPTEINVVPVTEQTNRFLTEAFTKDISGVDRRKLRSHYTLPQNELTIAPFLDTMMSSECSSKVKSTDHSLFTLQKLILEAIGPLSQLLEVVNNCEPNLSMDQIGDAVETAIALLANASNKTSLMRISEVLEEYSKEIVPFAAAQERDWTSAAPRLFGPTFLKDAADYLQQLQLVQKFKSKLAQVFRPASSKKSYPSAPPKK